MYVPTSAEIILYTIYLRSVLLYIIVCGGFLPVSVFIFYGDLLLYWMTNKTFKAEQILKFISSCSLMAQELLHGLPCCLMTFQNFKISYNII